MAMVRGQLENFYSPGAGDVGGNSSMVSRTPFVSDFDQREYQATQPQRDAQNEIARLGVTYGADQRQNRFNQVFPWLQGQMSQALAGGGLATAGGASGNSPEITVGGVWNPQQTQQQVNAARAGNDQTTANRVRSIGNDAGMRGFGSNSPLLQALQGQAQAANLGTNAATEMGIRNNAAEQNAGQVLSTQQAREQQFAQRNKEQIERAKPYWQTQNALISSLAGLV